MKRAPVLLPTVIRFPGSSARQDAWGRLLALTAGGAELTTAAPLKRGESVLLAFELGGERLGAVPARVVHAEDDADGHRHAELRWSDMVWMRRLAKLLVETVARS